jgi:hypothetical protein
MHVRCAGLFDDDPLIALLAAPIMRRNRVERIFLADYELLVGEVLREGLRPWLSVMLNGVEVPSAMHRTPPSDAVIVLLAGCIGPNPSPLLEASISAAICAGEREELPHGSSWPASKGSWIRSSPWLVEPDAAWVDLSGRARLCGVALAAAEWRRGRRFIDVYDDWPPTASWYARPMQPMSLHPTPAAQASLNACRARHEVAHHGDWRLLSEHARRVLRDPTRARALRGAALLGGCGWPLWACVLLGAFSVANRMLEDSYARQHGFPGALVSSHPLGVHNLRPAADVASLTHVLRRQRDRALSSS